MKFSLYVRLHVLKENLLSEIFEIVIYFLYMYILLLSMFQVSFMIASKRIWFHQTSLY